MSFEVIYLHRYHLELRSLSLIRLLQLADFLILRLNLSLKHLIYLNELPYLRLQFLIALPGSIFHHPHLLVKYEDG